VALPDDLEVLEGEFKLRVFDAADEVPDHVAKVLQLVVVQCGRLVVRRTATAAAAG
jgi:hypothetical protein